MKSRSISLKIDNEHYKTFKKLAIDKDCKLSDIINQILEKEHNRLNKKTVTASQPEGESA